MRSLFANLARDTNEGRTRPRRWEWQRCLLHGRIEHMSILAEIINGASGEGVSIDALLRKALVVASRLQSDELKNWAKSELNGYDTKEPETLPSYRGPFAIQADGLFINEYGTAQARHQLGANSVRMPRCGRFCSISDYFSRSPNSRISRCAQPLPARTPQ